MALYYLNNHGDVIYRDLDNKIYVFNGVRTDILPNANWTDQDVGSIAGFTYSWADAQGRGNVDSPYSSVEIAVAENLYHVSAPGTDNDWHFMYGVDGAAPASGVLRWGGYTWNFSTSTSTACVCRINGVEIGTNSYATSMGNTIRNSSFKPYNVVAGDIIEMRNSYYNLNMGNVCTIIPFTYP